MKQIKIVNHLLYVQVDDEDYHFLNKFDWWLDRGERTCYAYTRMDDIFIYMHKFLMPVSGENTVDHKDGNGLNNCKENLRAATSSQQMMNRRKREDTSSVYKGVYWSKCRNYWVAQIKVGERR